MSLIDSLIDNNLGYQHGEKIGVLHDDTYMPISSQICRRLAERRIPHLSLLYNHEPNKPITEDVSRIFADESLSILILGFKYNIWHTEQRKQAKYKLGKRLVNLLYPHGVLSAFSEDINQMNMIGQRIHDRLKQGSVVRITTAKGTSLETEINQTFCETGDYRSHGTGGDYPSGEVGFSPVLESTNGILVFDQKIQYVGDVRHAPHVVNVSNDKMRIIQGSEEYQNLLSQHPAHQFIAEVSIGLNKIHSNVDDPDSIVEEKNFGTFHIGCGGNASYGDRHGPHFDSVLNSPTIFIDGRPIMVDGELIDD